MPKKQPPKNNTGRFIFLATGLVVVLLLVGFLTDWKWHWLSWLSLGEPQYETPSVSPDYLPPDTTAVLHVNLREMQDSKYVNKELGPVLRLLLAQLAPPDAQQSLGVDVKHDVDCARVAATADESEHPLVMLSGRFDPARFQPSPKGPLRQLNKRGDRYPLYELRDSGLNATFTLAPADGMLLLSENPSRVTDALASAGQATPELQDATLAELLKKVDRTQSLWAVASQKKKPVPKLDAAPEHFLRPIFKAADAFYGGVTCGDEVEGALYFVAAGDEKAAELEKYLRDLCTSSGAMYRAGKFLGRKDDYLPLLHLLGTGKVSRDGNTVTLRCRLPEQRR